MKQKRIFMMIFMLVIVGIIIQPTKVQAALQASGGEPGRYNVDYWIKEIRQMQAAGGAIGLTDVIDATNLTSSNTNFDIHMQKNTEYGAMVLLSASAYGNPEKIEDGGTTTGNKTGVVMKINKEWTAASTEGLSATNMKNASGRYKNVYATGYKVGDAIETVGAWHGASGNYWLSSMESASVVRARSGSIFSYFGRGDWWEAGWGRHQEDGLSSRSWSTRAVVVVGSGI